MTPAPCIEYPRRAGILLHITSLPGGPGNGDLGRDALRFVDFLADCGIRVWQTLPIGPTHEDGSPYQCMSAHAGNPMMINLQCLVDQGWLAPVHGPKADQTPEDYRTDCLKRAFQGFRQCTDGRVHEAYWQFMARHGGWLDDFALFLALREESGHLPWQRWPVEVRDRLPEALDAARLRLADAIAQVKFEQFAFFNQWDRVRSYAHGKGIELFGDMPIFVAWDSAEVWARREYFDLTEDGLTRVVAGVPPDYFSTTGQRWGNPHYNWDRIAADGFRWWIERVQTHLELYDLIRIDHFRGFQAYWEIPVDEPTAVNGCWVEAPGEALLDALFKAHGGHALPLVAENLGVITPEVEALREQFAIPGMLILQFAFDGGPDNPYLPQNHTENNVVYTGTHDNDTTVSWFESLSEDQRHGVCESLGNPDLPMPWALIDAALASKARLAIVPMQDVLELGKGCRMNTPGTVDEHNWHWRFDWSQVDAQKAERLRELIHRHGRD